MFFSLHWWSQSTISLVGIRCSVASSLSAVAAASLSAVAAAGAPVPLFMYKFFRFSYIVWFLALLSTFSLPSWVFGLLRRCFHVRRRFRSRATLHQLAFTQDWRCFKFFEFFFNVLAYTSAAIRNSCTYKWYLQVQLYSRTLISSIYKCVLIKCDYTTVLINLK